MPLVMVHGHNSCYRKWTQPPGSWDDFARKSGFICFTPNYHSMIDSSFPWERAAVEIRSQVQRNFRELSRSIGDNAYPRWAYVGHSQGGLVARVLVKGQNSDSRIAEQLASIYLLGTPNSGGLPLNVIPGWLADYYDCAEFLLQDSIQSQFNRNYRNFGTKTVMVFAGTDGWFRTTDNDHVVKVENVHNIYVKECSSCETRISQHLDGQDLPYNHEELAGKKGREPILIFNILPDLFFLSGTCSN